MSEIYRVNWNVPADWKVVRADREVVIPARGEGAARAELTVQGEGLQVVTADVEFDGRLLREWTEAIVRVRR
jgi:hypothetical protein